MSVSHVFALCAIGLFSLTSLLAPAAIIEVGRGMLIETIAEGLERLSAHDTLRIKAGIYHEHSLVIGQPLHITGEEGVIIDGNSEAVEIFIITADDVHIQDLTLRNIGHSFLNDLAAIKVKGARHGSICNVEILDSFFGIYLAYTEDYTLCENFIEGDSSHEAIAGNAIHIWKAKHIEVLDNTLTGHRDGIYMEFVDSSRIAGNLSHNNIRYGLHFMFSNYDSYRNNEFRENGSGVAVMFSKQIKMQGNSFLHNWGGASYGLLLKEISDGLIVDNFFIENTVGIVAEGANRLSMIGNQFTSNGKALDIKGNCLDNVIERNNFLANTFEVVTNSSRNANHYTENYWSKYSGYDLDRDGIGDEPYRPVSLFAKIGHEIPSATILLHSFLIDMLDMGERLFPEVIPVDLIDTRPMMQPYAYDTN